MYKQSEIDYLKTVTEYNLLYRAGKWISDFVEKIGMRRGNLSVQVLDDDKNMVLEQEQVGNQTLQLPVDGRVTVILTADHHKGSFSICSE